jgi:hypothetical protein
MELQSVTPGVYYQDILADGSRSVLRQNFPTLQRVSFDKRPPVVETLKITVETLNIELPPIVEEIENWVKNQDFSSFKMQGKPWTDVLKDHLEEVDPPQVLQNEKSELTIEQAEKLFSGEKP